MRKQHKMRKQNHSIPLAALMLLGIFVFSGAAARAQTAIDFSGQWKEDNDRSQPKRNGDVTLRIEQHDPDLIVETTISHGSENPRHAVQKYTTDGKISVSTGADGDEFHTSIVWNNSSLVFSIEEHEDGRILISKETWSLIDNGATLERLRERPNGEKQTQFFRRIPISSSNSKSQLQNSSKSARSYPVGHLPCIRA